MRRIFAAGWPATPEENISRLDNSGFQVATLIPKCDNCGELGHIRKHCKADPIEKTYEAPKIKCTVCEGEGHRARDCTNRPEELCRKCKQPGHFADECTTPRSAEGVECNHCHEMGHFGKDCPSRTKRTCRNCGDEDHISKDCTNARNMDLIECRNCEKKGHTSKDCPDPKDWAKHVCRHCGESKFAYPRCYH